MKTKSILLLSASLFVISSIFAQSSLTAKKLTLTEGIINFEPQWIFNYDGRTMDDYGIRWVFDSWAPNGPTLWQSGWGGIKFFTDRKLRMAIDCEGHVGIGVDRPTVKLDVAGTIRAHEIKVCLNQGCDYVFAEDYNLMNLNDLNSFIKANKHLPEVAPAAQMEADGINVSEMNALLLKKVEELTLYVIELKNEIDQLKK